MRLLPLAAAALILLAAAPRGARAQDDDQDSAPGQEGRAGPDAKRGAGTNPGGEEGGGDDASAADKAAAEPQPNNGPGQAAVPTAAPGMPGGANGGGGGAAGGPEAAREGRDDMPDGKAPSDTEDVGTEVSLTDAKANVGTLIRSFMAQHEVGGALPLRDKRTRQLRRLKLVKVEEKGVKPAGRHRYSAPAALKDLETGQALRGWFTVDFTPPEWKVIGLRLQTPAAQAKKRAAVSAER